MANKRETLPGGIDIDALDLEVEDNSVIIYLVLSNSKRTVQVLRARGNLVVEYTVALAEDVALPKHTGEISDLSRIYEP